MPPLPDDWSQATTEMRIDALARDQDLAWTQIKTMQMQLDKLADLIGDLATEVQQLKAKRGPGRPPKPPLEDKVMP